MSVSKAGRERMSNNDDSNLQIPVWRVVSLCHGDDASEKWCLVPNGTLCSTHWLPQPNIDSLRVRISSAVVPESQSPLAIASIDEVLEKTNRVSGAKENMQPITDFRHQQEECSRSNLKCPSPKKRGILTVNSELCNRSTTVWKRRKHMELPFAKQNGGMKQEMDLSCVNPTFDVEINGNRFNKAVKDNSNSKRSSSRLAFLDVKGAYHSEAQNPDDHNASGSSCLFQTASGKAVPISNAGIKRATALFGVSFFSEVENDQTMKDVDSRGSKDGSMWVVDDRVGNHSCEGVIDNREQIVQAQDVTASSCLFQTAAGKAVSIPNAGMRRAMILLGEGVRSNSEVARNEMSKCGVLSRNCLVTSKMDGKLSGDSYKGATLNRSSEERGVTESISFFQTANGKTIAPSINGTNKPVNLLNANKHSNPCGQLNVSDKGRINGLDIRDGSLKCIEADLNPGLSMASTGQGHFVFTSNSAIKQTSEGSPMPSSCMTFMTGKGQSVLVSSSAMKRAKDLLAPDLDRYDLLISDNLMNGGKSNGQKLFQTAGGHLIKVSSGSIERAKLLLGDSSPNNDLQGNETNNKRKQHMKQTISLDSLKVQEIVPRGSFRKTPAQKNEELGSTAVNRKDHITRKLFKPPRRLQPVATQKAALHTMESHGQSYETHFAQLVKIHPFQWKGKHRRSLQQFFLKSPHQDQAVGLLRQEVQSMTAMTSKDYKFSSDLSGTGLIGSDEFRHMLIETGANPQFATKEWVDNHFRWIVWKLASLERSYPTTMANKLLSMQGVFDELRYRYEKEVNGVCHSALKKITEGDAQAGNMMVLCIAAIHFKDVDQSCSPDAVAMQIEITDGWYSLIGQLDEPLARQVVARKIFVGQKLRICGASLIGITTPMPPLEAYNSMKLALHINGTYRAHWAEKLGFCKGMLVPIAFHCIKNDGGLVPRTVIGIYRIYPILYYERLPDNRSITRSARAEEVAFRSYEHRRNEIAEAAVFRMEGEENPAIEVNDVEEGARLFYALETSAQPELLMADMTAAQHAAFATYQANREAAKQSLAEKNIRKALVDAHLDVREVTPFVKVSVMGLVLSSANKSIVKNAASECQEQIKILKEGIVTMWQVTEEQVEHLKEGVAYCVSDLFPQGGNCNKSNRGALHLRTTKSTTWRILPQIKFASFHPRQAVEISSLRTLPFNSEFDVAVSVLYVGIPYAAGLHMKQWLFVSDGSREEDVAKYSQSSVGLLAINISAISDAFLAVEGSLEGCVIGYCNLVKRHWDQRNSFWVAEASEISVYSTNFSSGRFSHLKNAANKVDKWAKANGEQFVELQTRIREAVHGES